MLQLRWDWEEQNSSLFSNLPKRTPISVFSRVMIYVPTNDCSQGRFACPVLLCLYVFFVLFQEVVWPWAGSTGRNKLTWKWSSLQLEHNSSQRVRRTPEREGATENLHSSLQFALPNTEFLHPWANYRWVIWLKQYFWNYFEDIKIK